MVRRTGQLLLCILMGLALAWAISADVNGLSQSPVYKSAAYLLLAIGLYSATYGIDLRRARQDKRIIVAAVTIGVIVKALLIGGVLALAWQNPLFLILGVAVAQIDPLSVAALMGDAPGQAGARGGHADRAADGGSRWGLRRDARGHETRLSMRARNVLAAWSSFDDPFTVILSIYAAAVAVNTFGIGKHPPSGADPLLLYAIDLGGNLLLAGIAWLIWRAVGSRPALQYLALLAFFAAAVATGWMLAIAIIGLFARPARLGRAIGHATQIALYTASIGLGFLLIDGIRILEGISLGVAAYLAQIAVAAVLTRRMPTADRWHLALAQQNGITAIILALTLQIQFGDAVAIIAPAIVTVNLLHAIANRLYDRRPLGEPAGDVDERAQGPA